MFDEFVNLVISYILFQILSYVFITLLAFIYFLFYWNSLEHIECVSFFPLFVSLMFFHVLVLSYKSFESFNSYMNLTFSWPFPPWLIAEVLLEFTSSGVTRSMSPKLHSPHERMTRARICLPQGLVPRDPFCIHSTVDSCNAHVQDSTPAGWYPLQIDQPKYGRPRICEARWLGFDFDIRLVAGHRGEWGTENRSECLQWSEMRYTFLFVCFSIPAYIIPRQIAVTVRILFYQCVRQSGHQLSR